MSSRLASLLVQDGLVSAKKMSEAFQRQVIYGGTLDTILLEMGVLEEPQLIDALGRATGLHTAGDLPAKDQLDAAGLASWFPHGLAEKHRAVPVAIDGNVVRVLVTDPPDRKQLDELGYQLSRSIDPIIVPEHRFVLAVEMVYGVAAPARFSSLTAKLNQRAAVSGAAVVLIEADLPPGKLAPGARNKPAPAPEPPAPEPPPPAPPPTTTAAVPVAEVRRAVVSDVPMPKTTQPMRVIDAAPSRTVVVEGPPAEAAPTPLAEATTQKLEGVREPEAPRPIRMEITIGAGAEPGEATPLAVDAALKAIDAAEERDAILAALCRGARSQLSFAALFMVHGELAVGRLALGEGWLARERLAAISVPLGPASPLKATVQGKAPYLGRIGEEATTREALEALGRPAPLGGVLVPIVLRERTVTVLYGDRGNRPTDAAVLAGLSTLAAAAARGFQRIILRQKGGEFRAADKAAGSDGKAGKVKSESSGAAPAASPDSPLSSAARVAPADGAWHRPEEIRPTVKGFAVLGDEAPAPAAAPGEPAAPSGPSMTDPDALLTSLLRQDEHAAPSAEALLLLGERGAQAVVAHLPGPLRVSRQTLRGPQPPLAEHGPLMALVARFGTQALTPLLGRLSDPATDVRFYATLAVGALKLPHVVAPLGERLMDPDDGVRAAAVEALRGFPPSPELRALTEALRGELPGPETLRQRFAAEALGGLRDVASVPRLIELVKHSDAAVVSAARTALITITKQDFGTSRWRWRSWWERHRHQPRLEWMLEGLGHGEAEVRMSAADELRALSHDAFGYHFDLPKREREEARRRWVDWFRSHGPKA